MWSNVTPARRLTRATSCASVAVSIHDVRLLADERERPKPTKRESFALQLANRRTQAGRQGGRRRFVELWDVRLDEVGRRVRDGTATTVGRRAPRRIAGNPTTRYSSASETVPSATLPGELGARAHAELAVDPGQMGFDRCDGREELRSDFAIRLSRRDERRDLPLGVRQLAIAPGSRPRPPQLLLGPLRPQGRARDR